MESYWPVIRKVSFCLYHLISASAVASGSIDGITRTVNINTRDYKVLARLTAETPIPAYTVDTP